MADESVLSRVWALLLGYALVFIMFIGSNTGVFTDLLTHRADPFLMMLFYLVFIFTISFIILIWHTEENPNLKRKLGLGASLFFGAFALMPVFEEHGQDIVRKSPLMRAVIIINVIAATGLIIWGLFFGSFSHFLELWLEDSFLHIMTVDFITLYIFSIWVAKNYSKYWTVAFIPVIGFYLFLYIEFNQYLNERNA
ncbi:MAG: hypothetical protein ACLFRI_03980 [Candidatus Izemoplasmataceae bacterium]